MLVKKKSPQKAFPISKEAGLLLPNIKGNDVPNILGLFPSGEGEKLNHTDLGRL